jgi:hypothetical protein
VDLAAELQKIYDSEINLRISWLWDGGIDARLGDEMNGYPAEENVRSVDEIIPCSRRPSRTFYPSPRTQLRSIQNCGVAPRPGCFGRHLSTLRRAKRIDDG